MSGNVAKTDAIPHGSVYELASTVTVSSGAAEAALDVLVTLKAVENDMWVCVWSGLSIPTFGTAGINDTNIFEPGDGYVNAYYLKQGEVQEFRLCGATNDSLWATSGSTTSQCIYSIYTVADSAR